MSRYLSPLIVVLVILGILAGSVFLYLKIFSGVDLPETDMPTVSPPPRESPAPPPPPPPPRIALPDLEESDEFLRALIRDLSSNPKLTAWLVNENLARRFVTMVDNISRGESPRIHVPFLEPEGRFEVMEKEGRQVIAEKSFRRYDLLTAVIASLDTPATVSLYSDLSPLFEEAYSELGNPDTFEEALMRAIDRLLEVDVPQGEIEVESRVTAYRFASDTIESQGPVAKHLLRMGPKNAREIQAKLLTFKAALTLTRSKDG